MEQAAEGVIGILTGRGPACDALQAWLDRVHARPAYRRALEKGGPFEVFSV